MRVPITQNLTFNWVWRYPVDLVPEHARAAVGLALRRPLGARPNLPLGFSAHFESSDRREHRRPEFAVSRGQVNFPIHRDHTDAQLDEFGQILDAAH
ncbi:hypothetical protein BJP65_00110 [Microbacterium sp. BH-3-3-3]|nr:hypothetical protein BJP65_00110 [Microbacterium sp. BH-3-3-3]